MTKHIPTIIALIMLAGHLDENGEPMKKRIINYEYQREKQNP